MTESSNPTAEAPTAALDSQELFDTIIETAPGEHPEAEPKKPLTYAEGLAKAGLVTRKGAQARPPHNALRSFRNHRGSHKGAKHGGDSRQMKPLPMPKAAHVFGLPQDATLEQELLFLGALRVLKDQHPDLKLEYVSRRAGVRQMLAKAWFLNDCYGFGWAELQGIAVTEIGTPDRARYLELEEQSAKSRYEQIERMYAFQQEMRKKHPEMLKPGEPGELPEFPPFNFQAKWNLATGYLLLLVERLNLRITAPGEPIAPYGGMTNAVRDAALLAQKGVTARPFLVVDLSAEEYETQEVLTAILGRVYPGFSIIPYSGKQPVYHLETADGPVMIPSLFADDEHADQLVSLLAHPNCRLAVGPQGTLTHAAWAAGLGELILLYTGNDYAWDAPQAEHVIALQRSAEEYADAERFYNSFGQVAIDLSRYVDRS